MQMTDTVRKILANYEGETPGVKAQLARMLMTGKLAGTGKMIILPVDQGFEHGPARSFAPNPAGYDPHYHYQLAIDAGLNAYAAQIAALIGAHIIKIKLSTDHLMLPEAKKVYEDKQIDVATQAKRVEHCMQAAFAGRRIVVFSGGAAKGADAVFDDARAIRDGGGNGSIIGRNSFQRSREDALEMLGKLVDIYKGA